MPGVASVAVNLSAMTARVEANYLTTPAALVAAAEAAGELLAKRNLQLTKSLGQNFLHDGNQLRRIVAAAKLTPADKVLEVGPGLGPLTELLLAKANEVLAVEMDGAKITTIEGVAQNGRMHLIQQSFIEKGAIKTTANIINKLRKIIFRFDFANLLSIISYFSPVFSFSLF